MTDTEWLTLAFWTQSPEDVRNLIFVVSVIVGGAIALIFTFVRTVALHRQGRAAQQGHITDRYSKAVEQLGSTELAVRLGGIYALERIARDSRRDHWTVMEVLRAFLRTRGEREHSPEEPERPATNTLAALVPNPAGPSYGAADTKPPPKCPADMQAAFQVVGRRNCRRDPNLPWHERLASYMLQPRFKGTALYDIWLAGVWLRRRLGIYLGPRINLGGADLQHIHVDNVSFPNADLAHARLDRAFLVFAHFESASFHSAHLEGAALRGAQLEKASFAAANLDDIDFFSANLEDAEFGGAHLHRAKFRRANLHRANFQSADLYEASFRGADLHEAKFRGADLNKANFRGANNIATADFRDAVNIELALFTTDERPNEGPPETTP